MSSLTQKYKNDVDFRNQMDQTYNKYKNQLQRIYYSDFNNQQENMITYGGFDHQGNSIYFVFGNRLQSLKGNHIEKFYLFLIKIFEEHFQKKDKHFSIIFFNTLCDNSEGYSIFRTLFRSLPLIYFENLKKVYIIHPNFSLKSLEWIVSGTINKYLSNHTQYVQNIQQLQKNNINLSNEFLNRIRSEILQVDYPKPIKVQPPKLLNNPSTQDKKRKQIFDKKPPVSEIFQPSNLLKAEVNHQVSHISSVQKIQDPTKKKLTDYEMSDVGIPVLLKTMVLYLKMKPEFLQQEGLFRKAVSMDDQCQAIQHLFKGKYNYIQQITNPHLIASLIKKFLSNLTEPLIPYEIYDELAKDVDIGKNTVTLRKLVANMPELNKVTFMFLLSFFIEQVISRQKSNKMSTYNVAVVLLPCLLRSKKSAIQDLIYSKKLVIVLENIIINFNEIFGDKKSQRKLYRKNSLQNQLRFQKEYIDIKQEPKIQQIQVISQDQIKKQ